MKSLILSSALMAKAYAIYNQNYFGATETSFELSWEDHSAPDYYKLTATKRGDTNSTYEIMSDITSASFGGLEEATIYDVRIEAWNATSDAAIGGHNSLEARTQGSGAFITSSWDGGAQGMVMWPISDEAVCGSAFNFYLPCPDIEMVDLGVGDGVTVEQTSADSMKIFVSSKSYRSSINWVAFGQCNWGDYNSEDFIVESFQGYSAVEQAASNVTEDASWPIMTGQKVSQYRVLINDDEHTDCAPEFRIEVPCEASAAGGWSFIAAEDSGAFDGTNTVFSGTLSNAWISEFGFSFASDAESDCSPSVTIVSQMKRLGDE